MLLALFFISNIIYIKIFCACTQTNIIQIVKYLLIDLTFFYLYEQPPFVCV